MDADLSWSHHNPVRVQAGPGTLSRLAGLLPAAGPVLLVTTPGFVRRGPAGALADALAPRPVETLAVDPNPDLDGLDRETARLAARPPAVIVALGGGSALDAAKTLSVTLAAAGPRPLHRALRLGEGADWRRAAPVVAVPTTAGTGAEVTPFATVWDAQAGRKHSVAGEALFPVLALLDPETTVGLPPDQTLFTGLDTLSHALESLWNRNRTPLSRILAEAALEAALRALPGVLKRPGDLGARAAMQRASLLAGLAISQTRTALAHAISYPLTIRHGVPHGLACGFALENLIRLHLAAHPDAPWRGAMERAAGLLAGLDPRARLAAYLDPAGLAALIPEMGAPGRAGNFDTAVPDLGALLAAPTGSARGTDAS